VIRLSQLFAVLACLLGAACGNPVTPLQDPATTRQLPPPEVGVVRLTGVLGKQELALCHRALRSVDASSPGNLKDIVFDLRDAGGDAESAADVQGLLDHLEAVRGKGGTVALVSGQVRGGAAYVALLCDKLFFLRNGALGTITPMPTLVEEIQQWTDENAERRRLREFASELRQRLDRRKVKLTADATKLCEGMIDPALQLVRVRLRERGVETSRIVEVGELTGLQAAGATILQQDKVTQPVMLDAREAEEARISIGTLQTVEQLCTDHLNADPKTVVELQYNWAEHMVGWLELLQPALLVLGLVLLILEVKTPGVGLPGLLGAAFLALALFYDYLVGLADITEILLFFLGLASLAVEIFLLPGMVVFGALGFLCLVFSLILSRQTFVLPSNLTQEEILYHNLVQLTLLFVAVLVFASLMWRVLPHVPVLNRLYLPAPEPPPPAGGGARAELQRLQALVGQVGRAATVLRPAGAMEIGGERYDVVTDGTFIEAGTSVRVVAVAGNRVVVERTDVAQRGSVGLVLLLAIVGMLLIVAEVFFMSFGVLALLSGSALIGAVFVAFQDNNAFGTTMLVAEAIVAPIVLWAAFKALPKTPFGRALMLEGPRHDEVAAAPGDTALLHKTGTALSPLRPAGFARIDGRRVDVVTRGEMLDQGVVVRVVEVQGNRVVVRADAGAAFANGAPGSSQGGGGS